MLFSLEETKTAILLTFHAFSLNVIQVNDNTKQIL